MTAKKHFSAISWFYAFQPFDFWPSITDGFTWSMLQNPSQKGAEVLMD